MTLSGTEVAASAVWQENDIKKNTAMIIAALAPVFRIHPPPVVNMFAQHYTPFSSNFNTSGQVIATIMPQFSSCHNAI
jgi:hypothetical protein